MYFIEEKMQFNAIKIREIISNRYKSSKDYIPLLKETLNLSNEIKYEKEGLKSLVLILNSNKDNYILTNDNFKKMVLLYNMIMADIPVIIMGETGCGKKSLIIKLNLLLNNGINRLEIINIYQDITDDYLSKKMKEINKKAKNEKNDLWVMFLDINTCLSFSLLTEIFINKTFDGEKLSDNIRLIGTCNPYRKIKQGFERNNDNELVYSVQPLPQSLLNYVFIFGTLNKEDEKEYIYNFIEKLFDEGEEKLHEATKDVLFECHRYLRDSLDPSLVSIREIS